MSEGRTRPTRQPIDPIHFPLTHIFIIVIPANIIQCFPRDTEALIRC